MRASRLTRLAALCALACLIAGCSVDATGLLVTLRVPSGRMFDRIDVQVKEGAAEHVNGRYDGRSVVDGDSFGVALPESLDGHEVTVLVHAYALAGDVMPAVSRSATVAVVAQQAVPVSVTLGLPEDGDMRAADDLGDAGVDLAPDLSEVDLAGVDLAGDMAMPDLSMADLSMADLSMLDLSRPDLSMPDLTVRDLSMPDLRMWDMAKPVDGPPPDLAGQVQATCVDPLVLDATQASVMTSGVVPVRASAHEGSCQPAMTTKGEQLWRFSLTEWTTVQLDVKNAAFTPALYVRRGCAAQQPPFADFQYRKPCAGGLPASTASCATGGAPTLTLCSLPPGNYYAYVDSDGSGAYDLTARFTPSTLNAIDCSDAGLLLPPYTVVNGDTRNRVARQTSGVVLNCGDQGATGKDEVYWLGIPDPWTSVTVEVRPVDVGFKPLVYLRGTCASGPSFCDDGSANGGSPRVVVNNPSDLKKQFYYVFVDGNQGTSGRYTLHVTVN